MFTISKVPPSSPENTVCCYFIQYIMQKLYWHLILPNSNTLPSNPNLSLPHMPRPPLIIIILPTAMSSAVSDCAYEEDHELLGIVLLLVVPGLFYST